MLSRIFPLVGIVVAMWMEHHFAGTAYAGSGLVMLALMFSFIATYVLAGLRRAMAVLGTGSVMALGWVFGGPNIGMLCGLPTLLLILSRHGIFPAALIGGTIGATYWGWTFGGAGLGVVFGVSSLMLITAVYDVFQWRHSLRRAFPLLARVRWFCELIRPELQQYFIERNTDNRANGTRDDWEFCIGAAKNELHDISLGTARDYHKPGQIHIRHKAFPISDREPIDFAPIVLGATRRNEDGTLKCRFPAYIHGRVGVGDMSFGSLGANAVQSLASGAGRAGILLSTGEGGLTPYHLNGVNHEPSWQEYLAWSMAYPMSYVSKNWRRERMPRKGHIGSGDIMLELGTGKFGCRDEHGNFDFARYAALLANPKVVATKLKLSQGAKPGAGGILPGAKVTPEIAKIRGIPVGQDCRSPNTWSEFSDVPSMMAFIAKLQEISGKPVGIKLAVGDETIITQIAEWMRDHPNEGLDFIHIDGGEGGTGAAPLVFADFVALPILQALPLVDNVFRKHGIRDRVVVMSSGKVFNPAQLFIQLAIGADYVFCARGFMNALGCIGARKCALGTCPTGIATHDKWLQRALVPRVKYIRVANYAEVMHLQLKKLLRIVGKRDTFELTREDISLVIGTHKEVRYDLAHPYPENCGGPRTPPTAGTYGLPEVRHPARLSVGEMNVPWVDEPQQDLLLKAVEPQLHPSEQQLVQLGMIPRKPLNVLGVVAVNPPDHQEPTLPVTERRDWETFLKDNGEGDEGDSEGE